MQLSTTNEPIMTLLESRWRWSPLICTSAHRYIIGPQADVDPILGNKQKHFTIPTPENVYASKLCDAALVGSKF